MPRIIRDWIREYEKKDALWIHDGNKKRPHALLTSGNHSNGFFNSRLVIPDETLLADAAVDLLALFQQAGGNINVVAGVVGPQTGATKLAYFMSDWLRLMGVKSFHASPAKHAEGEVKSMVFTAEELKMLAGQTVLLCEDVLTTGGSIDLTVDAITKAGGVVLPYVLVLVNRSGLSEVSGKKIVALIDQNMPIWLPAECPLCKDGSEAMRAKENWAKLNASY